MSHRYHSLVSHSFGLTPSPEHDDAVEYMASALESYLEDLGTEDPDEEFVHDLVQPFLHDMGASDEAISDGLAGLLRGLSRMAAAKSKAGPASFPFGGGRSDEVDIDESVSGSLGHIGKEILGRAISHGSSAGDDLGAETGTMAGLMDILEDPQRESRGEGVARGRGRRGKGRRRRRGGSGQKPPSSEHAHASSGAGSDDREGTGTGTGEGAGSARMQTKTKLQGKLAAPPPQRERSSQAAQKLREASEPVATSSGSAAGRRDTGRGGLQARSSATDAAGVGAGAAAQAGRGRGASAGAGAKSGAAASMVRQDSALDQAAPLGKAMAYMLQDEQVLSGFRKELVEAQRRFPGCRLSLTDEPRKGLVLSVRALVRTDKSGFLAHIPMQSFGEPERRPKVRLEVVDSAAARRAAAALVGGGSVGTAIPAADSDQGWISPAMLGSLSRSLEQVAVGHVRKEAQKCADEHHMERLMPGWMGRLVEEALRHCLHAAARADTKARAKQAGMSVDAYERQQDDSTAPSGHGGLTTDLESPTLRREQTLLEDTAGKGIKKRRKQAAKSLVAPTDTALFTVGAGNLVRGTEVLQKGVAGVGINKEMVTTSVLGSNFPDMYRDAATFVLQGRLYVYGEPNRRHLLSIAPGSGTHQWVQIERMSTLDRYPWLRHHFAHPMSNGEVLIHADRRSHTPGFFKLKVTADRVETPQGGSVRRDRCTITKLHVTSDYYTENLEKRYGSVSIRLPGGRRFVILGGLSLPGVVHLRLKTTHSQSLSVDAVSYAVKQKDLVAILDVSPTGSKSRRVYTSGAIPKRLVEHRAVACGHNVVVVGGEPLALRQGLTDARVLDCRRMVWYNVVLPAAALKVRPRIDPMLARLPGATGVLLFGGSMADGTPLGGLYSLMVDMTTATMDPSEVRAAVEGEMAQARAQLDKNRALLRRIENSDRELITADELAKAAHAREDNERLNRLLRRSIDDTVKVELERRDMLHPCDAWVLGRWELLHTKVKNPKFVAKKKALPGATEVPSHLDISPVAAQGSIERLGSSLIVFGGVWADAERRSTKPNKKAFLIDCNQQTVRIAASQLNMDIARLWEEQLLVDVLIRCRGGQTVPAHRSILTLFLPYFRRVFREFHELALEDDSDDDSDSDASGDGEEDEEDVDEEEVEEEEVDEEEQFRKALLADLAEHVGEDAGYTVATVTTGAQDGTDADGDHPEGALHDGDDGFMTERDAEAAAMAALQRASSMGACSVGGGGPVADPTKGASLLMPPLDPPDGVMEIEEDMDGELLKLILEYIYTGGIEVPAERVQDVLELATLLGLHVTEEEAEREEARKVAEKETVKELKADRMHGGGGGSKDPKKKSKKSSKTAKRKGPPPLESREVLDGGVEALRLGKLVELCKMSRGGGVSVNRSPTIGHASPAIRAHLRTGILRNEAVVEQEKAAIAEKASADAGGMMTAAAAAAAGSGGGDEDEDGVGGGMDDAAAGGDDAVSPFVPVSLAHVAGCDVVVVAGDESVAIPAHRAILAARSPYFRSLFDAGMAESRAARVPVGMEDAGREVTEAFVRFLYDDSLARLEPDDVPALLTLANLHVLPRLASMCERLMLRSFDMSDPESVLGIYCFAAYQGQAGRRLMQLCADALLQLDAQDVEEAAGHLAGEVERSVLVQLQRTLRRGKGRKFGAVDLLSGGGGTVGEGAREDAGSGEMQASDGPASGAGLG